MNRSYQQLRRYFSGQTRAIESQWCANWQNPTGHFPLNGSLMRAWPFAPLIKKKKKKRIALSRELGNWWLDSSCAAGSADGWPSVPAYTCLTCSPLSPTNVSFKPIGGSIVYSLRGSSPPAAQKIPNNFDKKSQKLQSEKKGRELDNTHTRRLYLAFSLFLRIGLSGTCFHSKITTYPIHVCVYSLIHMKLLRFRQAEQMNCFLVFFFFFLLLLRRFPCLRKSITSFIDKEIPSIVLLKKNARFLNVGNFERQKKIHFLLETNGLPSELLVFQHVTRREFGAVMDSTCPALSSLFLGEMRSGFEATQINSIWRRN